MRLKKIQLLPVSRENSEIDSNRVFSLPQVMEYALNMKEFSGLVLAGEDFMDRIPYLLCSGVKEEIFTNLSGQPEHDLVVFSPQHSELRIIG